MENGRRLELEDVGRRQASGVAVVRSARDVVEAVSSDKNAMTLVMVV